MLHICLFLIILTGLYGEDIPVMHEGRVRPYALVGQPFSEDLLALPDRYRDDWHPLGDLEISSTYNFTPFPDEVYFALVGAWKENDLERVKTLLAQNSSQSRLKAERIFYEFPWRTVAIALYTIAALLFLFSWRLSGLTFLLGALGFHTILLALRCYILERPPVSNMQETVVYVPWIAASLSTFWVFRFKEVLPGLLGALFAAMLLLAPLKEGLDNVQPVLNSNFWLIIHVMMIVASYGVLILGGLFAHIYVLTQKESAFRYILPSMYIGVSLLIPGTILGGIWAAESWGRFWDWDPKESWAFISAAVYLAFIHGWRYGKIGKRGLAIGAILGLMAISFTWYGVNYILGTGLHSYGFGNGGELYYWIFLGFECLIVTSTLIINGLKNNTSL